MPGEEITSLIRENNHILTLIEEHSVKFVDFRFTDLRGKEQHVSVPVSQIDEDFIREGKMFDGSSIAGWKGINESDMVLKPDVHSVVMDPFFSESDHHRTLNVRCDILEPSTGEGYNRDPRSIAKRAEAYLASTGIADATFVGPEPEFFVFDQVSYSTSVNSAFYKVDSEEGSWNSGREGVISEGDANLGHRPGMKGGYFPVAPVDSSQTFRNDICNVLEQTGMTVEAHHHEVATGGQNEIATQFNTLVNKADELQMIKYVVHNVANEYGKTATFMPKPLVGDNGSGMHVHISLSKEGENLFAGDGYAGLSDEALWFIGGIIKHGRALNFFTNSTTNSYKRLVPGFEAPTILAYSARNRSAGIRVPHTTSPKARRIEVRFPDAAGNPYLTFTALLMAGLDGIRNKIHPGDPMDKNLYDLPPEELQDLPTLCASLEEAVVAMKADREFLLQGNVFTPDVLDALVELKLEEINRIRSATHPAEFDLYYSA